MSECVLMNDNAATNNYQLILINSLIEPTIILQGLFQDRTFKIHRMLKDL